ncbi:Structural maintenance of chromosomes protein 6 [Amphibalanus amphitrite]|uniref:Structural maintenance of chromosomes protein 6 n=1 Tax=Amphibalanus amphitrite TaxID=1232801 RepID=A0A6A4VAN9_AMPAM|nr:Structural maintenance of chromosomes protein 6 [Amphibalanus amphitrite]
MPKVVPKVVRRSTSSDSGAPARKRSRSSYDEPKETLPQGPGFLRSITLKNFMCHEHLNFKLNERINFIKGQNGSGKSAVLTAVMVGLGARAATTDRGSNIKGLIRTGQKSAVISLTLDNSGYDAFSPEKYGGHITIERSLKDSGGSTYRISSEKESRLRPMQKGELATITDGLGVQVDNPLVILTQETSKNFLRGEDPKKKYRLFLDATRLTTIERWYEKARRNEKITRQAIESKQKSLVALKEEVKKWEREANLHKNRADMKRKIATLKANLLWAKVIEEEKKLDLVNQEKEKKENEVVRFRTEKERLTRKVEEKGELPDLLAQLDRERAEQTARADQLTGQLRELAAQKRDTGLQIRRAEDMARVSAEERDTLRAEIERQRRETQPDYEAEAAQRRRERDALADQLKELQATEKTRAAHLQQVTGSVRQQREELRQSEAELEEMERKRRELEAQQRQYRSSQADPRAVFGPWVAAVERDIEAAVQQRRLRKKPIGPVGAFVRVKAGYEEWKPLVETCLAGLLRAYLVDDKGDLPLVAAILKKHTQNERDRPRAIASKFLAEVHDISTKGINTSSGQHVSVWSVLEIDNPVVANAVIDQARAESVLLLRTEAEARAQMADRQRVPRGCAQALTQAGFRYFPDPNYRTYPVNVPRQARYLQVSMEEVISDLALQLQELRHKAQTATNHLEPAQAALRESQRQESESKRLLDDARRRQGELRRKIRELESHEDPEPVNLQALEEEVNVLDLKIEEHKAEVPALMEKRSNIMEKINDCQKTLDEARAAVQAKLDEVGELRSQQDAVDTLKSKLRRLQDMLDAREQKLMELTESVNQQEEVTRQATATATANGGERTNPTKTVQELQNRIVGLSRTLEDDSRQPKMSAEEAMDRFQTEQLKYQQVEEQIDSWKTALDTLAQMMNERDEKLKNLRTSLGSRVTSHFHTILEARGFGGRLDFQHQNQKLEIEVSPGRLDGGGQTARATCQLSGGERSFSTIAFLMAMWSVVVSPFRMLDEYDVFMDDANRRLGHDMLVTNALALKSQFAFFTPLSIMGSHEDDDRISLMQ